MLEDGEIIRRCLGGQAGMMDLLIDRYKADLYSLCVKLTRDRTDADDLFQDTWVKVMKGLKKYKPEHKFRTWLFAVCTNQYRDLYRWRKRWLRRVSRLGQGAGKEGDPRPEDELTMMEDRVPGPEEQAIRRESRGAVRAALDTLDDTFRLPMVLHYFQDLSVAEIADVMKIPQGTVKTRLSRGREKLRAAVEAAGHGR